jgi:hypothetical protein
LKQNFSTAGSGNHGPEAYFSANAALLLLMLEAASADLVSPSA